MIFFQRFYQLTLIIAIFFFILTPSFSFGTDNIRLIRIGTGGQTGVYYPIGKIIAQGITSSHISFEETKVDSAQRYICAAQNSGGSISNVKAVTKGEIEAGLVQADVAAWALKAKHVFKGNDKARDIRAIASLYPEKFQIVTRRDAKISSVNDLRGKRISVDEIGSGTLAVMRIILETHGLKEKDLKPVYLKPVFTHDKIVNNELQGFVMMAGAPMEAVSQLLNTGISLVPITPRMASIIESKYPYLVPGSIPVDTYPGIPNTPTIQVHALMAVNKAMDEELVYKITAALWSEHTLSMLKKGHPQGQSITADTALDGISIPLHPGAKKYYQKYPKRFSGPQLQ
jgi:uncharacterized protein